MFDALPCHYAQNNASIMCQSQKLCLPWKFLLLSIEVVLLCLQRVLSYLCFSYIFFYNLKTTSTSLMSWVRKKCSSNCLKNQQTGNDRNSDCLSIYSIYGVLYFLWKHDTFLAVYCTLLIIMMMIMIMNLHSVKTIEEYSKALSIKLKSMNK